MSNLALVYDKKFQQHLTPEMHPESPMRLVSIEQALQANGLIKEIALKEPRRAAQQDLTSVHQESYIEELEVKENTVRGRGGFIQLDPDTYLSPKSYETAILAAGAGLVGIDAVMQEGYHNSFVLVRPPGHHALSGNSMGFCLFNNIAVAARYAQKKFELKRIAIIDWDVHHGNGTQAMFYDDPSVCFISLHQYPFWPPNSGWYLEDGVQEGQGFNINIPLPAGTADTGYLKAWDSLIAPICLEYKPDLILLSAGYDAHQADPLAKQEISTEGYFLLANRLAELSERNNSRAVCFLEGGYNLRSLAESVLTTMKVLNAHDAHGRASLIASKAKYGGEVQAITQDANKALVDERLQEVKQHFSQYWQSLKSLASC